MPLRALAEPEYPNFCSPNAIPTMKEVLEASQNINALKGKIDQIGNASYTSNAADSKTVKDSMKTFCCAMYTRYDLQKRHDSAKQDYEVAKQRVESVRYPAKDLSYLGTIVPFGRPLRPDSVPVLMGVTIVFVILSLALLLGLGNVHLMYSSPGAVSSVRLFFLQLIDSYRTTSKGVLLITILLSAAAAGGIYYGIQKTHPEWLGLQSA